MTHLSVPSFWRLNKAKYGLVGAKCDGCGKLLFPPRTVCPGCGGSKLEPAALADSGQILTWTAIHAAPEGFDAPYTVALVRLEDGIVVPGQVVGDLTNLGIGANVRAVFRRLNENKDGLLLYGFKFVLSP
jgi:hypothetical protein